ncbi:hypothetical protein P7K49_018328 [Saguinus oedipus]|uniref:Uncharacterized protein n=1 Tax=Saguinus oedipus TaxID=9490 RepID=A0ABQ9V5J2_SAGOE|nr:hypothetical protein P7K49_018328 [Saguinus oedipus]
MQAPVPRPYSGSSSWIPALLTPDGQRRPCQLPSATVPSPLLQCQWPRPDLGSAQPLPETCGEVTDTRPPSKIPLNHTCYGKRGSELSKGLPSEPGDQEDITGYLLSFVQELDSEKGWKKKKKVIQVQLVQDPATGGTFVVKAGAHPPLPL